MNAFARIRDYTTRRDVGAAIAHTQELIGQAEQRRRPQQTAPTNRAARDPTQPFLDRGMTRTEAWAEYDRLNNPQPAAATDDEVPPGFSCVENYRAYKKAVDEGRVTVHGGCTTFPAYRPNH